MHKMYKGQEYVERKPSDSRTPCPALNALANHGYVPHDGKDIEFFELVDALVYVYNISWWLALGLTFYAFLVSGETTYSTRSTTHDSERTWTDRLPLPRWRLDLKSLSKRGGIRIAHDASLVHPSSVESCSPDKLLVHKLLTFASTRPGHCSGLSLTDLACYHHERENELSSPLDWLHEKIALGECGLAWAVMRKRMPAEQLAGKNAENEEVIPESVLGTWFGSESLPEDWWAEGGSRPVHPIGLREAVDRANDVAKIIAKQ